MDENIGDIPHEYITNKKHQQEHFHIVNKLYNLGVKYKIANW